MDTNIFSLWSSSSNKTDNPTSYTSLGLYGVDKLWSFYGPLMMASLTLYCILQAVQNRLFHSLSNVPGPKLASISQIWRNIRYFGGSWHDDVVSLHKKYGKVVRIAPNEVSFVDATALKSLYGMGKTSQKVSENKFVLYSTCILKTRH